jgi:hypothetical protein
MPGEPLRLGNEYATVEVSLDESANGPRLRIVSVRDELEMFLDPVALALLCHADDTVFALLADEARDHGALADLRAHRITTDRLTTDRLTTDRPGGSA